MRVPISLLTGNLLPLHQRPKALETLLVDTTIRNLLRSRFICAASSCVDICFMPNIEKEAATCSLRPIQILSEFRSMEQEGYGKYVKVDIGKLDVGYNGMPCRFFVPHDMLDNPAIVKIYDLKEYSKHYGFFGKEDEWQ